MASSRARPLAAPRRKTGPRRSTPWTPSCAPFKLGPMMLPVDAPTLFTFMLTASAIVLTPGPDTLIILRYAIRSGPRVGLATVAGGQAGLVGHTVLAVLGISVLIASIPWLFKAVAIAGAAYIAWIGIQSFRPH